MTEPGTFLGQPAVGGVSQQVILRGTNPAAGASFSLAVDGAFVWRLIDCTFTLTTSGVAANRFVTVQKIGGDTNPFSVTGAAVTVSANSTQRFNGSMYRGHGEWAANADVFFPLSPTFLRGSDTLKINVANIDTTDTLTLIYLTFDRFVESYPEQ